MVLPGSPIKENLSSNPPPGLPQPLVVSYKINNKKTARYNAKGKH
jgi:hypothetical protein